MSPVEKLRLPIRLQVLGQVIHATVEAEIDVPEDVILTGFRANKAVKDVAAYMTFRETQVYRMICLGLSNKEIGAKLNIAERTVKVHVSSLLGKFKVKNRTELAGMARAEEVE